MLLAGRLRWRWVVVALVGSLLAVPAVPAGAADGEADYTADFSACVGRAGESAGFDDVGGYPLAMREAIDCLAHYAITRGVAPGKYAPGGEVTRWQMALFLIRAAGPAGIVVPRPSDQGFTDIGGLAPGVRDAVNQLAALGISRGTTRTTFSPHRSVTRRQMARFLAAFLDRAPVGEGGVRIKNVNPDETLFEDIGDLPLGPHRDIGVLFEMGVATGTSRFEFSPEAPVTRAQMAVFITRALAHTNARPAGITMQTKVISVPANGVAELVISVRDRYQRPAVDASVDLFHAPSRQVAFNSSGGCTSKVTSESGVGACVIDTSDDLTNTEGNLRYELTVIESLVLWAWTGAQAERFDLDSTDFASRPIAAVKPATHFRLTDSLHPGTKKVRYGRTVIFTFQLVDVDQATVAREGVELRIRTEDERSGRVIRRRTRTYSTDPSGQIQFGHFIDDPNLSGPDETNLKLTVLSASNLQLLDKSAVDILTTTNKLPWSDGAAKPATLVFETKPVYQLATSSGSGGRASVTALLLDQYGDPVRGKVVHFKSDDTSGLHQDATNATLAKPANRRPTNRRGQAIAGYFRDSDTSGLETITAFVPDETNVPSVTLKSYWAQEAPDDGNQYSYQVVIHDADRRTLVLIRSNNYYMVRYDENDQFNVGSTTELYDSFRKKVAVGKNLDASVQSHHPDRVNTFKRYE